MAALLQQAALADFMTEGGFVRHLRKMTREYRERRSVIEEIIKRDFSDHFEVIPSEAGLHLGVFARTVKAPQLEKIVRCAAEQGVALQMLWPKASGKHKRTGLMLGYGAIGVAQIRKGLSLVRECFEIVGD